jgi:hypothetical protein
MNGYLWWHGLLDPVWITPGGHLQYLPACSIDGQEGAEL